MTALHSVTVNHLEGTPFSNNYAVGAPFNN